MFCHPALASLSVLCDWARAQSPPTRTQSNTASLCLFWPLRPVHLARPAPTQTTSRELQCGGARSTSSWRPSPWHMAAYVPSLRCSPSSKNQLLPGAACGFFSVPAFVVFRGIVTWLVSLDECRLCGVLQSRLCGRVWSNLVQLLFKIINISWKTES